MDNCGNVGMWRCTRLSRQTGSFVPTALYHFYIPRIKCLMSYNNSENSSRLRYLFCVEKLSKEVQVVYNGRLGGAFRTYYLIDPSKQYCLGSKRWQKALVRWCSMFSLAQAIPFLKKATGNVEALPFACGVMNILWSQGRPGSGVNANNQQGTF